MPDPNVIAIFGPTGVGKTAVAVELARLLRGHGQDPVAISADALQVYAGLEVLTGAASSDEQRQLEHRLISFLPITETFSAGRFAELAHAEIDAAIAAGRTPIVVGGTGLYLRAALAALELKPPPNPGVRGRILARLASEGLPALYAELERRAPAAAAALMPTDRQRVIRALELLESPDATDSRPIGTGGSLWTTDTRHPTLLAGLTMERACLYRQIDTRVDAMVAAGAADEARRAADAGASLTARKALGFDQLLAGDIEAMKAKTRQYARRQLTWMRKLPGVELFDVTDRPPADTAAAIVASLSAR